MARPVLKFGAQGNAVLTVTRALKRRGHIEASTSVFDARVRAAVREFQARHVDKHGRPLASDGVVGPLTWWALDNEVEVIAAPVIDFGKLPPVAAGGSVRGRAALQLAIDEMLAGARETGSNNSGAFVKKYLNGILPPPANWCAGFVSWCFAQHPAGIPYRYTLGARNTREQFRDKGWLLPDGDAPEPGDIIVWWRGQPSGWMGHIGLVHHSADGMVYTIEGNKGAFPARVRGFDYVFGRIDKLLGFGRVPF